MSTFVVLGLVSSQQPGDGGGKQRAWNARLCVEYRTSINSISDNVFLATAAAVQMYPAMATVGGQYEHLQGIYPHYQILAWPLAHIVQLVSVWMMVLVAGNRYVAVCRPLHASSLCSRRHIRWQIVAMVTACVVYSLPRFAEFRSDRSPDLTFNYLYFLN